MQIMYKKGVSLKQRISHLFPERKNISRQSEVLVPCFKSSTRENVVLVMKSLCNFSRQHY